MILYLSVKSGEDPTGYVITIFSMLFTIVSIALGVFEYVFGVGFIASGAALVIQFDVETQDIKDMNYSTFQKQVVYKRKKLVGYMTKELEVDGGAVDRLVPTRTKLGAKYTFIIEEPKKKLEKIRKTFYQAVDDNSMAHVCELITHVTTPKKKNKKNNMF